MKGFRDFLLRGNVIELAVAVVVGSAFAALVKQFADSFIYPLVKLFSGGGIRGGQIALPKGVTMDWAAFVNALIAFLITAAVTYFVFVLPTQKLLERRKKEEAVEPAKPSEAELLAEIRDLLRDRQLEHR